MNAASRVYVVIVNWNGWADTLECLESVFRLDPPAHRVVVCDNASTDGSLERIEAWAAGQIEAPVSPGSRWRHLSSPPVPKPVSSVVRRGDPAGGPAGLDPEVRLELVPTGSNLGFAGGNNVAMRLALARDDFEYAWLLNNDTVVEKDALRHLVARMRDRPGAGMCGSTLRFYEPPHGVQAHGGATYNPWLGMPGNVERLRPGEEPVEVESRLAYVMGASMLVSKAFLRDVGLMSEDYFLFYEELDWAARAGGRYSLAYAPESRVYHKGGRSTGLSGGSYDVASDYYMNRAQLMYARRHTPWLVPFTSLRHLLMLVNSLVRWRPARIRILGRIYL
ncbi:MAG TPA: glycosyltransferase family 2 protein, partial [Vicinamibacteria bacterium]